MKGKSKQSKTNTNKKDQEKRRHKETEIKKKKFLKLDYRFKNNTEEWMCVILKEGCDLCESYRLIQAEIEEVFGDDAEYFIPIQIERVGNKNIGIELYDGYIFVKKSIIAEECLFERRMECLDSIMPISHDRYKITNRDINGMKTNLKHMLNARIPKKGDRVIAIEGTYKNLEGSVVEVNENKKQATIEFKKKTRIVEDVLSVVNFEIMKRKRGRKKKNG